MSTQDPVRPSRGPSEGEYQTLRETLQADPFGLASHPFEDAGEPVAPPKHPAWALVRLVLVVALILGAGYAAGVGETLLLVLALIVCIVAHELGHYIMAKWAGVKVTEFFVGFGPRLWSVRRGETEYGVKSIPLGGYCRIVGMSNLEEVDPIDEPRTYRQASTWRRLSIVSAGSAMHFLIAIVVLFAMFFWTGDQGNYLAPAADAPIAAIDGLANGPSPAEDAGFRPGDRIEAIDGHRFPTWSALTAYIQAHPGTRLDVTVRRSGHLVALYPVPVDLSKVTIAGPAGQGLVRPRAPTGFLGIQTSALSRPGLTASISDAGGAWVSVSARTLHALGHLFTLSGAHSYIHMLSSKQAADNPNNSVRFSSPVKVVQLFHQAGQDGLSTVLYLLAVVNISLGIFNLGPLLPLDGGHVAIAAYEGVRSRRRRYRVDLAKLLPLFYVAIAAIVFLGATSLFLDIRDLAT